MTVSWRRSAWSGDAGRGSGVGAGRVSAAGDGVGSAAARRVAIASSILRRWPTMVTPMSLRSSAVSFGRISPSMALSRNAWA